MNEKLPSILVIGCGSIGERHVRTFLATGRVGVIACESRPAILKAVGEKYGVATVSEWSQLLGNRSLSAVVVATPAPSHVAIAVRCLEAGHHVLIEKPLSLDLEGVDALLAARDKAMRFAGVGYVLHFAPALRTQGGSY